MTAPTRLLMTHFDTLSPAGQGPARAGVRVAAAPSGNRATTRQTQPGACARMARARLEADRSRPYLAWLRRDGVTVTQLDGPGSVAQNLVA